MEEAMDIKALEKTAAEVRVGVVKAIHNAGSGHHGGSLSAADIVTALYFLSLIHIFPDGRTLPEVRMLEQDELFDCDMFVFCASKGVPPVGAAGDVRMAQLEANSQLVGIYADMAVKAGFGGIFAVVSDPVDPLCKAAVLSGLAPEQVQGYGLGVMNGRASYFAAKDQRLSLIHIC